MTLTEPFRWFQVSVSILKSRGLALTRRNLRSGTIFWLIEYTFFKFQSENKLLGLSNISYKLDGVYLHKSFQKLSVLVIHKSSFLSLAKKQGKENPLVNSFHFPE